ncbi:MAG: hypothetical protein AAF676_06715 [Pseudomonadota bacterium]
METFEVALAETPVVRVISVSPGDGDARVGPTARPRIDFSRPVDPSTFDADAVFATDAAGRAFRPRFCCRRTV